MKQIVEQLNKIAKKIDDSVELPNTDLITDSLDAITKALGGTPNKSNLIVDKLEDIAKVATKGGGDEPIVYIPEQTVTAEEIAITQEQSIIGGILNNVAIDLDSPPSKMLVTIDGVEIPFTYSDVRRNYYSDDENTPYVIGYAPSIEKWVIVGDVDIQVGDSITISAVSVSGDESSKVLVLPETEFTSEDIGGGVQGIILPNMDLSFYGRTPIYVSFDGVDYEVEFNSDFSCYGDISGEMPDFSTFPFYIFEGGIATETGGEHTVEIYAPPAAPIQPEGSIYIDYNGTFDVTEFAEAVVNVQAERQGYTNVPTYPVTVRISSGSQRVTVEYTKAQNQTTINPIMDDLIAGAAIELNSCASNVLLIRATNSPRHTISLVSSSNMKCGTTNIDGSDYIIAVLSQAEGVTRSIEVTASDTAGQ